ncbi:putative serine/threonine protein kinase (Kin4) [Aspergillus lucknowensis]|uniref:Protein kinase domain-containing protein n=1 Tax=Aspergillus lucknowensis TaxID=176173 RepID=A0ABR4LGM5_9EURO
MSDSVPQALPRTHASPAMTPAVLSSTRSSSRSPIYPDLLGAPPIPPPRTSSNHRSHRGSNTEKGSGSRHRSKGEERSRREKKGDDSRSRRHAANPTEDSSRGSSTHRRGSAQPENPMETIPSQGTLVKESSTVINQVLVSDPAVDIERERARQVAASVSPSNASAPASGPGLESGESVEDGARSSMQSRQDFPEHTIKRKETTFGQYILGQTVGEGEFGKVKLGWKRDGSIEVAIKLIRRESLGNNPSRLPKIYREISILRDLSHPNIVRLHEMVETDRHIGIIMEYASGGELFDHILRNRYLKDNAARRLFAQLVSGVGYLHKKGIVHRDLKLENLLLDRNRNIIITDFGFANTFDPDDELSEEIEYNLTNKEFVKRMRLDKPNSKGIRRGDLMQTSCGSPCYAAPELVVSDSLYTGRKVDVWSCGVILYAMLAGYLPFDDDPANPDGDNINLLYKYIVTTPLTFPEYVTPHARDLLRRILVPDPRKRADLFEVARHSWLSEYSDIVSHITSSTTKATDISSTTVSREQLRESPSLARSASVREPPKTHHGTSPSVGGLVHHAGDVSQEQSDRSKTPRETKRRTVQVEYVAPQSQTSRGNTSAGSSATIQNVSPTEPISIRTKPPSQDYVANIRAVPAQATHTRATSAQPSSPTTTHMPRSTSDTTTFVGTAPQSATAQATRPTTGGSMASFNTGRLPSRGSYGQPVAPTVAATNAQGRLAQPKSKQYVISAPIPQDAAQISGTDRPGSQNLPSKFNTTPRQEPPKGHKRSNTVSSIGEKLFGRSGSIFGGRKDQATAPRQKTGKRYPPTSMRDPYAGDDGRASMDSRRSAQYGYNRKASETAGESRPRRFSLLPASFSLKGLSSSSRSQTPDEESLTDRISDNRVNQRPSTGALRTRTRATSYGAQDTMAIAAPEGAPSDDVIANDDPVNYQARIDQQFAVLHSNNSGTYQPTYGAASAEQVHQSDNDHYYRNQYANHSTPTYYDEYNNAHDNGSRVSMQPGRSTNRPGVLQKSHRKFADAYEYERDLSHHSGSSGAARKVMDFFRRRAKSRAGDER